MTIRVSTIRNISLNQPALPSPRAVPAVNRTAVVPGAIPRPGEVTQSKSGQLVGQGLSALGRFIQQVDQRKDEIELLRFGTALEQQVAGLAIQARQEAQRPSDIPRRFLELHKQTTDALLDQVEDFDVRAQIRAAAGRQRAGEFARLIRQVDTDQRRVLFNEGSARIELKKRQAVNAGSEAERKSILGEINLIFDRLMERNAISETGETLTQTEITLRKREAAEDIQSAIIRSRIIEDPSLAVEQLQTEDAFPNIPKDRRLAFLEQAMNAEDALRNERIALMERAEKLHEKALQQNQDAMMVELQSRIADPKEKDPTISEINALARARMLTDTQQRILIGSLTSEEATSTDPATYIDFEQRIYGGEFVSSAEIIQAMNDGLLERSEGSRLLTLNRSERDDRVSAAKRQIKLQFGGSGLIVDVNSQQKQATALQRFNRLLQNSPDADPFQLSEQSVKETRLEFGGGISSEPPPRPATLGMGEVTEKSIKEGRERLIQMIDNDAIGEKDAQVQMRLYREWESFLDAQSRLQ